MNIGQKPNEPKSKLSFTHILNSKPKTFMIAMFPPPFSSGERMVNLNLKEILTENYEVEIINVSTGRLNPAKRSFSKIYNQFHSFILYCKAIAEIRKRLKINNYHALYFVTPCSSFGHIRDWLMLMVFSYRIQNIFAFIHNGNFEIVFKKKWHRRITRSFITRVSKFIFLSNGLMQRVNNYIPAHKCTVIRNSIQSEITFTNNEIAKKIKDHNPSLIRIAYISNMNPAKGYMDIAVAINMLNKKRYPIAIKADFAGEWLSDKQLSQFKQFVFENELENIITIHGKISDRSKIKKILYESTIFALPTYFSQEAQPLSIIEALNAGTPVIATAHASIPEYITHAYNGFLIDKQSPQQIVEAIEKMMQKDIWIQMAKAARKSFIDNFSLEIYKQNIFSLFEGNAGKHDLSK